MVSLTKGLAVTARAVIFLPIDIKQLRVQISCSFKEKKTNSGGPITCLVKTSGPRIFFCLCLHAIQIHHQFTHTSLLAQRRLTFCFPRAMDLFPKAGCQNLSTHLSFCQPSQQIGSFLLHQKGATPSFLHSHTDQKQRGRVKALVQSKLGPQLLTSGTG